MSSVEGLPEEKRKDMEKKVSELEDRMDRFEENIEFLRGLLLHIKNQFQSFKSDIEKNRKS